MPSRKLAAFAIRAVLIVPMLALASCESTPKVNTDYDASTDFSRYRSFSWVYGNSAPTGMNPLMFERVRQSVDRALSARFTPGNPGDFAVAFTVGRRDRVEVTDFGPYAPYYRPWAWGPAYNNVDVRNVTDGTLIIDFYDTATKKPVWHGIATNEVDPQRVDQAMIDKAVDSILAKFPPSPSSK